MFLEHNVLGAPNQRTTAQTKKKRPIRDLSARLPNPKF
ncbi:unnamed protein product [Acidithrix sp. C25]|nr:unnamed protein product [Acidithrix sp. C25]